jgi:RAQPRD family integrative conjugative element protein
LLHYTEGSLSIASFLSIENDAMSLSSRIPAPARCVLAALLLAVSGFAFADAGREPERLAAMLRQLDLIDRQAESAARLAPLGRAHDRFDYERLREDLQRVRAGIQDYLVPRRAQPRDPVELKGAYRRSTPAKQEATP